jgi:hypothetical protein
LVPPRGYMMYCSMEGDKCGNIVHRVQDKCTDAGNIETYAGKIAGGR